jgi:16S rRNA processing protein RimM
MQRKLQHKVSSTDWVIIGRFGRPHGIKGYITVIAFTEPRENLLQFTNWHVHRNEQWQPLAIKHVQINLKHILVQVANYDEREQAAALTNCEIAVNREQLPKLEAGEYYWHQLIGMQVVTSNGVTLGDVTDLLSTGAHDVLIIQGKRRHLVPYVLNKFVLNIDDVNRQITVDWDEEY